VSGVRPRRAGSHCRNFRASPNGNLAGVYRLRYLGFSGTSAVANALLVTSGTLGRPQLNPAVGCPFCARNRKLELEQMCEIARERGGKWSLGHIHKWTLLLFYGKCGQGHRWKARPARVKNGARAKGSWCLQCYNLRRVFREELNIQVMRKLGLSRGGICLSTEYAGSKTKLTWQCALKHRWEARPVSIVQGTWCPQCARNQRLALTDMREDRSTQRRQLSLTRISE